MNTELENTFLKVFETNKDRIFRICRSYATDKDDAKDLYQDVLLNIWKSIHSFKNESNINTWVYRITLNVCLRAREFAQKRQSNLIKLDSIHFENIQSVVLDDDKEMQFIHLTSCIKELESSDQSIILLYLEDLAYKEIAEIVGLSENHVAVKVKRIKSKLLTCINAQSNV